MMVIGMLWQDLDPKRSLVEKIKIAVDYYKQKYGHVAEIVVINQAALEGDGRTPAQVQTWLKAEGFQLEIRVAEKRWPPAGSMWIGNDQSPFPAAEEAQVAPV